MLAALSCLTESVGPRLSGGVSCLVCERSQVQALDFQLKGSGGGDKKDLFLKPRKPVPVRLDKNDSGGSKVRFSIKRLCVWLTPGL